jgi:DNA-binding response OmpR family regulator
VVSLSNLLNNAFKFTSTNGKVTFHVATLEDSIVLEVKDNGVGIDSKELPYIFTRYYKTNEGGSQNRSGMGLGLAIVKEYVELLEGTIKVNSIYGQGTSFQMVIPQKLKDLPAQLKPLDFGDLYLKEEIENASVVTAKGNESDKSTILLVEDNISIIKYLSSLLAKDFIIETAFNGVKGLEILKKTNIDLIISDIMMPEMDGMTFLEEVKQNHKWRKVPFIMLTALDGADDKLKALKIGVDDYLTKPFDSQELITRIDVLLENYYNRVNNVFDTIEIEAGSEEELLHLSNKDNQLIGEIEKVIKLNISNVQFDMRRLAEELNISYSHLFPTIKRITGLTPNQYFNEVRFSEARRLMETREYESVKSVAYSIGFKDVKYFSKQFKKRFGRNPSEYFFD